MIEIPFLGQPRTILDRLNMIITPQFVFIHMPKTGGTFVQKVLNQIYGTRIYNPISEDLFGELLKRALFWERPIAFQLKKHAPCSEIPAKYLNLPIVSCIRNPFDWYISNYRYGWWRSNPDDYPDLRSDPRWPELTFEDYFELSSGPWVKGLLPNCRLKLGRLSALFILYYCKNPHSVSTAETYTELFDRVQTDLYPVDFMMTETLNLALYDLLMAHRFPEDQIEFIREKKAISPRGNRKEGDSLDRFYTPQLEQVVRDEDRLLFDLFPTYSS